MAPVSSSEGFSQGLKPAHVSQLVCPLQPLLLPGSFAAAVHEHPEQGGDDQRDYQGRERGPTEDRELLRALHSGASHDSVDTAVSEEEPPEGEHDGGDRQYHRDGLIPDEQHTLQLMARGYQLKRADDGYEYEDEVLPGADDFQDDT
jgi:hypothetical protein